MITLPAHQDPLMSSYSTISSHHRLVSSVLPTSKNFGNLRGEREIPSEEAAVLLECLKGFTTLKNDWNGHGALPMSFETYQRAHAAILAFDHMSFLPESVSPSADGGFEFSFRTSYCKVTLHVDEDSWEWSISLPSGERIYYEEACTATEATANCATALIKSAKAAA